jgi:hypothetical protein
MSLTCPHCGLLSPPEAARCDCGYDFATGVTLPSYLDVELAARNGGADAWLVQQRRTKLRSAGLVLGMCGAISVAIFALTGTRTILWPFLIPGVLMLYRALRLRRPDNRS